MVDEQREEDLPRPRNDRVAYDMRAVTSTPSAWQPIGTFPRDGSEVEVQDQFGLINKARWGDEKIKVEWLEGIPVRWRTRT